MKTFFRILGTSAIVAVIVLLGTLHGVGYRSAYARVEDYVTTFGGGVPSVIEPYGVNHLMKTTQVRYNDDVYQVSFSSTAASIDDVISGYAQYLSGAKLFESLGDGKVQSIYHSDGTTVTAIRAMAFGPSHPGTMVQKVHAVKSRKSAKLDREALAGVHELAPIVAILDDESLSKEDKKIQATQAMRQVFAAAKYRTDYETSSRLARRQDVPGFDLPQVPRHPEAVRRSSVALDQGLVQMVRYSVDADPDNVIEFYQHALPGEGWQGHPVTLAAEQQADAKHLVYQKGTAELNVVVTTSGKTGLSSVTVMLQ